MSKPVLYSLIASGLWGIWGIFAKLAADRMGLAIVAGVLLCM